jgi:nucleotide-binding universal stress UspA family protein
MHHSSLPLAKILLPYDGSPSARTALRFAAALVMGGCEAIQSLTLLYVTGGGYLARHVQNVDLRVTRLDKTKEWQRIRQHYLDEEIKPLLQQGQELLRQYGFRAPIELKIVEGKIGERILEVAQEERYTTIIMGRRGLSPVKELLLGSATHYVLTRAAGLTVFIVGPETTGFPESPLFPLLLPVDGSEASLEAVRQAAILARGCTVQTPRITLLHVVDLALLGQTLSGEVGFLLDEGQKALTAARQILDQAGLKDYTQEKLVNDIPAQAIAREAADQQCTLIFMGSVGHSALARFFIGSITNSVLHLVTKPAVAVVYP